MTSDHDSDLKHGRVQDQEQDEVDLDDEPDKAVESLNSRKALWAFLILCFSTGPTASMVFNYVSAAIQSAANLVGHVPGSDRPCARRGRETIECVVRFGAGEIDYLSYLLYLRAIGRAMEGVVVILVSGLADYSSYRKTMMMTAIVLFGALALPFAGLTDTSYSHLTALSVLYCCLTTIQGVYVVIEASYIPIFMRSVGWFRPSQGEAVEAVSSSGTPGVSTPTAATTSTIDEAEKRTWRKGFTVSVLALVAGNLGGLTALIIGVILVYSRGSYVKIGYHNYLLAITIAGCITIIFAIIGQYLLPPIRGKPRPKGADIILLPARNWYRLLRSIRQYPQAFKMCIAWVLWHTAYSNYLGLIQSLFLQVTGISNGSGLYQVWSFTNVIFACMGSLGFLYLFPRIKSAPIKSWAYVFYSVNFLCILWGCLGIIPSLPLGYKHAPEFWIEQVLFMSTSSALRSYNRAVYASLIPRGSEAQFFGLEITLDLATGWINPLVQGVVQERTGNLRVPMAVCAGLMGVAGGLWAWVDVEAGRGDARVLLGEIREGDAES